MPFSKTTFKLLQGKPLMLEDELPKDNEQSSNLASQLILILQFYFFNFDLMLVMNIKPIILIIADNNAE